MLHSILQAVIHPISSWRVWRRHRAIRNCWHTIDVVERERHRAEFIALTHRLAEEAAAAIARGVPDEHEEFPGDAASTPPTEAANSDPLDTPLPCDITIGRTRIGKGCAVRTLVIKASALNDIVSDLDPVTVMRASGRGREITALRDLAESLLDPERNGYAVGPYVRDAARRALGIEACETTNEERP